MRPLLLKGHERPVTFVCYNKDGDLVFSCGKDGICTVWFSETGERLGTVKHRNAINCCDVDYTSTRLLTAAADNCVKLWNVKNGEEIATFPHNNLVRFVQFGEGCRTFVSVTDNVMGELATIYVWELPPEAFMDPPQSTLIQTTPALTIPLDSKIRITSVMFSVANRTIIAGDNKGVIRVFDPKTGELLGEYKEHTKRIVSMNMTADRTMLITCSGDRTAKLWDATTMKVLKTYETEKPVNCAAIAPLRNHILIGGGQDASLVTTTVAGAGQFEVTLFHKVYEEMIGTIKGHFGPINALSFHPDNTGFASGGEDGYVRVHKFDDDYDKLKDN
eukprot:gb/GECH01013132.1/.p1 GENE.gb/GECH01013132.1/~~gb/GECH01013132.1/.p1  ORF type:complete len:332 (+),score=61.63 gb/GECH01013132.1/:1-996(+)